MKRILALILVACTLLSMLVLVGCPAPSDGGTTTTTKKPDGGTPSEWADTLDTAALKKDFGGQDLVISVKENFQYEIYAEEDSKNALEQLVYKRNKKIEERFGITIKADITKLTGQNDSVSHLEYARNQLQSMAPEFDLLMMMAYQSGKLIASGYYRDWRSSVPYAKEDIAAGSPWWPVEMNISSTVKGRQFVALSDMSITAIDLAYGMLFNQKLMTNENVMETYNAAHETSFATIYDMVDAGAWTLDAMIAMTKDFWIDNDADPTGASSVDKTDVIGFFGGTATDIDAFAYSFGFRYIENDGVADPTVWTMPATFDTTVNKLVDWFYNTNGATMAGMGKAGFDGIALADRPTFFAEGHALFKSSSLKELMLPVTKGMEDDYGIVPYPKLDGDQTAYLTGISDNVSVLSVPRFTTGKKLRMTGAVVVALSAETHKSINDTYYEMIVKHDSGFVDKRSVEMVDKMIAGRVYDLGMYHHQEFSWQDGANQCFAIFLRYLLWNKEDASGVWSGVSDFASGAMKNLIKMYENLK